MHKAQNTSVHLGSPMRGKFLRQHAQARRLSVEYEMPFVNDDVQVFRLDQTYSKRPMAEYVLSAKIAAHSGTARVLVSLRSAIESKRLSLPQHIEHLRMVKTT